MQKFFFLKKKKTASSKGDYFAPIGLTDFYSNVIFCVLFLILQSLMGHFKKKVFSKVEEACFLYEHFL